MDHGERMKKLWLLMLILLCTSVYATNYLSNPGLTLGSTTSTTGPSGWRVTSRFAQSIVNVTLHASVNATRILLYNDAQTIVYSTGTCSAGVCTFSNSSNTMTSGGVYFVLVDANGGTYTYKYQAPPPNYAVTATAIYINASRNNGGTTVTNEWPNLLTMTTSDGGGNVSTNNLLTLRVNNSVNGTSINTFCINATGTNTTQNTCTNNGTISFNTTGTYNISAYNINIGNLTNYTLDAHNATWEGTDSVSTMNGIRIIPNRNVTLISFQKNSNTTATRAYILDASKAVLQNVSYTGVTAIFNYNLVVGTTYYLADDNSGATYTRTFSVGVSPLYNINGTNINFTGGLNNGGNDSTRALDIGNVTTQFPYPNLLAPQTYFNETVFNYAFTNTSTLSFNATQAYLTLGAYRLYLNTSISSFNATNDLVSNTTSTSSLTVPANNGSNNIQIAVAGNFSLNFTCTITTPLTIGTCNPTGVYDGLFKINATSANSGTAVTTFTATVTNTSLSAFDSRSTTNGSAFLPVLQGYSYQFGINPTGFALQTIALPVNSTYNNYSFSLLFGNSLYLAFYNEQTNALITQNVSVLFNNGTFSFTNSTVNGTMIVAGLTSGEWTLISSSNGFGTRQSIVTIADNTSQALNVYLLNSTAATSVVFTIKDGSTTSVIPNAMVMIEHQVNSTFVVLDTQISDIFGVAQFDLVSGESYRLIVTADGYQVKEGDFTVTTSSYIVILDSASGANSSTYADDVTFTIAPDIVNASLTNFTLTTVSPSGALSWFAVVVSLNGTNTTSNVTASPSGGSTFIQLNLSLYPGQQVKAWYYLQSVNFTSPLVINRAWIIPGYSPGNLTLDDFMTHYADDNNGFSPISRGIILTIMAVILGGLVGFIFGGTMAVVIASGTYLVGGWYGWLHPVIVTIVVAGLLGTVLIKGGGR